MTVIDRVPSMRWLCALTKNLAGYRLLNYDAIEGRDYTVDKFINGRQVIDYHVTMDIAKHCAMLDAYQEFGRL